MEEAELAKTEERLLDFFSKTREAMHIDKIAKSVGISRVTASKHLATLEAKGIIECRQVGMSKLYGRKKSAQIITAETKDALAKEIDALIEARLKEKLGEMREKKAIIPDHAKKRPVERKKSFEEMYEDVVALAKKIAVIKLLKEKKISIEKAHELAEIHPEEIHLIAKAGGVL